jgi:hypothetical protein
VVALKARPSRSGIEYEVHDGIFKAFCDKAGTPIGSGASMDFGIGKNPRSGRSLLRVQGQPHPLRVYGE